MEREPPKHPLRARIVGVALLVLGGACAWLFTVYSNATLARFGFPRAWAGAPILLGAVFCGITGGFLLVQRRFSLGGLLIAVIVAVISASSAQAYLMSSRVTDTQRTSVYVPKDKKQQFIDVMQHVITKQRLIAFAEDLSAACRPREVLDFQNVEVSMSPGSEEAETCRMITTLNFEFTPFIHAQKSGIRWTMKLYAEVVNHIKAAELFHSPFTRMYTPKFAVQYALATMWSGPGSPAGELVEQIARLQDPGDHFRRAKYRDAALWLRDHEPEPEVKQFFADVLKEFDAVDAGSGK